jgi:parallel beta-helix repeat protein
MLTIVKKNDSYDAITYQLENEDNSTVDLTGASVNFVMGKKNKLITNAKATVTSATSGIVSYQLTQLDTLVSGTFLAEFVVTFANGTTKTYPSNGYITVDVEQNLDTSQANVVVDMIAEKQGDFTSKLNSILQQAGNINMSAMNEYSWTATEGQLIFIFPSSVNYTPSTKWFQVSVGNVPVDNTLVNRSYDNQFALNIDSSNIKAGMTVRAMWVEPITPVVPTSYKIIPQQDLPPVDAGEGDLWFDTSDNTYQGTIFDALNTQLAEKAKQSDLVYINVKNPPAPLLGAKGDGITDDTTAINNIFANSTNRYFYFPTGTYRVQYTNFSKGVHLLGDGFDKTIIKRVDGYTTDNFNTFQSQTANIFGNANTSFATRENVSIEGICFDGNVSSVTSTQALAVMFNNVQLTYLNNLYIKSCKFINSIGDGLWFSGVRNAIIDSCYFDHCGYHTSPTGTTTRNNMTAYGSYYNGVVSQIVETNTTIKNCFFNDPHDMAIVTRNPKSLTVDNCEFTNMGISSLELYGDSTSGSTNFNTFDTRFNITNNVFQGGNITHGDGNKNYKESFVFKNNSVNCPNTNTTFQFIGNINNFDLFMSNNTITVPVVYIDSVNKLNIQDNDIQYNGATGMHVSNTNYSTITGNTVNNNSVTNTNGVAIVLYTLNNEPIIENNTITGVVLSTKEAILCNYTDSTTIRIKNIRVIGNKIDNYGRGVNISSFVDNSILINSNIIDVPVASDYAIKQWSGACRNVVANGNIYPNNTSVTLSAGANTKIDTKGSGTVTIGASFTSNTVFHGLGYAPTVINVTPQGNVGNVWVSGITSSQFTVNCSVSPASTTTFSWRAS